MTQPQLDLLRRMAEQSRAADMDVALGWNIVLALVNAAQPLWECASCGGRFPAKRTDEPKVRCSMCLLIDELARQRDAWQKKYAEVGAELQMYLDGLNEWTDTNSRAELTDADRKLFALMEEGRS